MAHSKGDDFRSKEAIVIALNELRYKVNLLCRGHNAIQAAYIFGSASQKAEKEPEDIDIALLVDEVKRESFSVPAFMSMLEKTLGCRVDVVVLNRAGEVLKYEVRRTGELAFERSPGIGKKFEISSRKSYEDFLFLHKKYVNKVLYGNANGK